MKSLFRLLLGLAVFLGAVSPSAFPNEGTNVALTGFSVGFQGCYKDGCLTPAAVRFTSGGGDAETSTALCGRFACSGGRTRLKAGGTRSPAFAGEGGSDRRGVSLSETG